MTLGLHSEMSTGESEFTPIVMYMARAGRLYKRDRVGGANGFENMDTELPAGTKFVVDFGSVQVGFLHFSAGQAPSFAVVPLGQTIPAAPSKDHRRGFRLLLHLGKSGGLRELASTAKTVNNAVDALHSEFEAAPEARQGKVPIVEFAGTDMVQSKNIHGVQTNFAPKFKIIGWIDRLADFGPRTVPPPGQAQPKSNGGNGAAPRPQATTNEWNDALAMASQTNAAPGAAPPGKDQWGGEGSDISDSIPF